MVKNMSSMYMDTIYVTSDAPPFSSIYGRIRYDNIAKPGDVLNVGYIIIPERSFRSMNNLVIDDILGKNITFKRFVELEEDEDGLDVIKFNDTVFMDEFNDRHYRTMYQSSQEHLSDYLELIDVSSGAKSFNSMHNNDNYTLGVCEHKRSTRAKETMKMSIDTLKKTVPTGVRNLLEDRVTNFVFDQIYEKIRRSVKQHFGTELRVSIDHCNLDERKKFYDYLARYSPAVSKRLIQQDLIEKNNVKILNSSFLIRFDKQTFAVVLIGSAFRSAITGHKLSGVFQGTDCESVTDSYVYMYIFGKSTYKHYRRIYSILYGENKHSVYLYNVSGGFSGNGNNVGLVAFRSTRKKLPFRALSTIFMETGVIEEITRHIDRYLDSCDTYTGKGIIYKTGILLYGNPGTGKTSLINALASKYNRDLIKIDMTTFSQLNIDLLTQTLDNDTESRYIIALEDIDCIIANRESADADKDDKKVVNKLLQFLDSTSSPNNVIFIATTNHVELLDDALQREARFDLKINIDGILLPTAIEMCKSFNLNSEQISSVVERLKDEGLGTPGNLIRQAKLQKMILEYSGISVLEEEVQDEE